MAFVLKIQLLRRKFGQRKSNNFLPNCQVSTEFGCRPKHGSDKSLRIMYISKKNTEPWSTFLAAIMLIAFNTKDKKRRQRYLKYKSTQFIIQIKPLTKVPSVLAVQCRGRVNVIYQGKRKLTGLHDSYSSWHLYICRFLFGLSTFLQLHSCLGRALRFVL